jgi:DNA primase
VGARTTPRGTRFSDDWVERVRAASDLVELVGQSIQLKRAGRSWVGLCPFHAEKSPSFSVSPERQLYHCHGCKAGGDVFRYVQEIEKVGFVEAVELLSRRAGIPVPERRAGEARERTPLLEALEQAARAYVQWLEDPERGLAAREYLERRGLTADTVSRFRLGLAPEGWENLVQRLGGRLSADLLVQSGLTLRRDPGSAGRSGWYDRFRNRLMIPLVAPGGAVIGFGARALGDENPKYLNSPETPVYHKGSFLFALEQARRAIGADGELIVVEGYFDAIALHQAGLAHTVATSGTALTSDQARMVKRLAARVALTYDGDAAGREAMMRSLGVLLAEGLEVVVVDLPEGVDPDTLVRTRGPEGWRALRSSACDPIEFVQRHLLRGGRVTGESEQAARERALQAVVRLASTISDPIRFESFVNRADAVLGGQNQEYRQAVVRTVALRRGGESIESPVRAAVRDQRRVEQGPERTMLQGLLRVPEVLAEVRGRVSPEDFRDPAARSLAAWLWGGEPGLPDEEPAASLARGLLTSGSERIDWTPVIHGAAQRLVERRLRQELKERTNRLKQPVEDAEAARLMHEIDEIARSLRELSA